MLFGTQPHLPVDALLGRESEEGMETNWLSVHRERLQDAHARAREYAERKAAERTERHKREVYCPEIAVGQQVYLRHRPAGRNKIQDVWAPQVYVVKNVQGTTYVVEPDGGGVEKRVHRSHLQPCPQPTPVPAPRRKVSFAKEVVSHLHEEISAPTDIECVVVEETWRTATGQSVPSADECMKRPSSQVKDLIAPEIEEQESVEETLTALEKSVDEGGDGMGVAWVWILLRSVQSLLKEVIWRPRLSLEYPPRRHVGHKGRLRVSTVTHTACLSQFAMQSPSAQTFCLKCWPAW
ncbi:uncharacterized protein [Sinocyclocheilus grahami]|uniref:uncharacterized protein n=1 Tax=Sinocyclocheilus grahami TaxID=75366 RepID=UPI0007AC541B|nr:PREDICTED: uncharacterized protein LOC107583022 [Sinocyclocheilus grahami]